MIKRGSSYPLVKSKYSSNEIGDYPEAPNTGDERDVCWRGKRKSAGWLPYIRRAVDSKV
jgi:hypothetical protein